MSYLFETLQKILTSGSDRLEELASIAGVPVEELFFDESFDGVDLRNEPVAMLRRIDADFSRAVLTVEQKRQLAPEQTSRSARQSADRQKRLPTLRRHRMEGFVMQHFQEASWEAARSVLVAPLSGARTVTKGWTKAEQGYAAASISHVVLGVGLVKPVDEALLDLLIQIKAMRLPVGADTIDLLVNKSNVKLNVATMRIAFDFDFCTDQFIDRWLEEFHKTLAEIVTERGTITFMRNNIDRLLPLLGRPQNRSEYDAVFLEAAALCLTGRTHASPVYLASVVSRASTYKECVALIGLIKPKLIDRETAAQLARILTQRVVTSKDIETAILETSIDHRIVAAFRKLVAVSGDKEAQEALLRVVSNFVNKASGIELDTILSDIGFDAGIQIMAPCWAKFPLHYRRIAIDSLEKQATGYKQSRRVFALKEAYLTNSQ